MMRRKLSRLKRRGSALTLAAFVVILLSLTGLGMLSLGQSARVFAIRNNNEILARSAADAGLTKAVWAMSAQLNGGDWFAMSLPGEQNSKLPNSDATFSYSVYPVNAYTEYSPSFGDEGAVVFARASTKIGDYVVRSVGRCRGEQRRIYATLRLTGSGEYGLLVRDSIILKSGTLVDSRDSRFPKDLDPDVPLEIGTLSTEEDMIVLNRGVTIDGNVVVGVGGKVERVIKDLGADTGARYPMIKEPELRAVTAPLLRFRGELTVKGKKKRIGPGQSGRYTSIRLENGRRPTILEIHGGDVVLFVTGDISLGQGCELVIKRGSTLNLYINGDIHGHEKSAFNNQGTPPDLKIWGTGPGGQHYVLNTKSKYFGQIYAPNADITLMAKSDLWGAFIANSFEMKAGGNLYYDGALRDVDPDDKGVRFVLNRWYESQ